jgi:hypothetical protein
MVAPAAHRVSTCCTACSPKLTPALATLEVIHMPSAPTEAIIALSIVFLASEIVHEHDGQM